LPEEEIIPVLKDFLDGRIVGKHLKGAFLKVLAQHRIKKAVINSIPILFDKPVGMKTWEEIKDKFPGVDFEGVITKWETTFQQLKNKDAVPTSFSVAMEKLLTPLKKLSMVLFSIFF